MIKRRGRGGGELELPGWRGWARGERPVVICFYFEARIFLNLLLCEYIIEGRQKWPRVRNTSIAEG